MKYLVLAITLTVFTGSYFVLKTMYEGGNSKGAERIVITLN
ncbi:MAG: hypothetical protein Ctma_0530 [Catillopecten margaritatus gill symbiont]|uniref:Uncharacterized protein n=1 Tax=Catillopecten margaritatus gill symbiont TaxID=3083288 RepID=A0AAU6PFQ8_9GAMM